MRQLTIEQAQIEDITTIAAFNRAMAWETEQYELSPEILTQGVSAIFQDKEKGFYIVAKDKSQNIIACLLITFEWSDWRASTIWWIQSVYVKPEYRRQGVFREMYHHTTQLAKKQHVSLIRLYVVPHNNKAIATYQKLGMQIQTYWVCEAILTPQTKSG